MQGKIVDFKHIVFKRVAALRQVDGQAGVGIEGFVGEVFRAAISQCRLFDLRVGDEVEHILGEIAAAGVVDARQANEQGIGAVVVRKPSVGDVPLLDLEAKMRFRRVGIRLVAGSVGLVDVVVGLPVGQHLEADHGPVEVEGVDFDFLAPHDAHRVERKTQFAGRQQRIAPEGCPARDGEVAQRHRDIGETAEQTQADVAVAHVGG